jgi:hypothetical protein
MRSLVRSAIVVVSAASLWFACNAIQAYPFIAGQYNATLDCVNPGEVIDVLGGTYVDASCDATCVVPPYDSGVYITGACPPFPQGDDISGTNRLCAKALAAINRHDLCLEAGPSNPAMDAGTTATVQDAGSSDAAQASDASGG